jgi:hypothetical protein
MLVRLMNLLPSIVSTTLHPGPFRISGTLPITSIIPKTGLRHPRQSYCPGHSGSSTEAPDPHRKGRPFLSGGNVWGIRPIAHRLRIVPDFCHWRGLFVLASDQTDRAVGQPQSGLWFGNIDDLWKMDKPTGSGGPWWDDDVKAGAKSDTFLMTGFDKKVLHLSQDSDGDLQDRGGLPRQRRMEDLQGGLRFAGRIRVP